MKIFGAILAILLLLISAICALLWSDFGNSITKPYIEKYIKEKTGFDVKLSKFDLNFSDFDIAANVNGEISANAKGKYSLFIKSVDAQYTVEVADLKSFGVSLDEPMNVSGQMLGNMQKFSINGAGRAFDSNLKFLANLDKFMPRDLQIDAKGINVAKALAVLNQPLYVSGNVDIISDIKANGGKPNGTASVKSENLLLNEKAFTDLNITLPSGVKVALNSDISVQDAIVSAKSDIKSSLANLSAQKSVFDMDKKTLNTDFALNVPELAKLAKIINYEISGDFNANGNLKSDMQNFTLENTALSAFKNALKANFGAVYNAKSKDGNLDANFAISDFSKLANLTKQELNGSAKGVAKIALKGRVMDNIALNLDALGGNLVVNGNLKNLSINAKSINIAVLTSFLGMEAMAGGALNATAKLSLADAINGNVSANVTNGTLYKKYLDKTTGKSFPGDVKFGANVNTDIKNSVANFTSKITSDLANFDKFAGTHDIKKGALNADFTVAVANLAKMKFLTMTELKGSFTGTGNIAYKPKNFAATLNSDIFSGKMAGKMVNDDVTIKLSKFAVKGLTDMLGIRHFYDGVGDMDFVYNTKNQSGKFDAIINQGRLASSDFLGLVSKVLGRDLAGEVYNNATVNGTIVKNLVTFKANMTAQKSKLNVEKGTLNTATSAINIPLKANIEKTDLDVLITGTTKEPKYKVSSNYLKEKLGNQLEKGIGEIFDVKKNESGNVQSDSKQDKNQEKSDAVKSIIKGLFK